MGGVRKTDAAGPGRRLQLWGYIIIAAVHLTTTSAGGAFVLPAYRAFRAGSVLLALIFVRNGAARAA